MLKLSHRWVREFHLPSLSVLLLSLILLPLVYSKPHANNVRHPQADPDITELISELSDRFSHLRSRVDYLNGTVAEKRRLLARYRDKIRQLDALDEMETDRIDKRTFHTWDITTDQPHRQSQGEMYSLNINVTKFCLNHPEADHRHVTKVQSASLRLFHSDINFNHTTDSQHIDSQHIDGNTFLLVYQILPGGMRRLITSYVTSPLRTEHIAVDIGTTVEAWLEEPQLSLGLELESPSSDLLSAIEGRQSSLDVFTYEKSISPKPVRSKRGTKKDKCIPGKCCKETVNVRWADIGLHLPELHQDGESFKAYLCRGKCSKNHLIANNWSNIKNYLFKTTRDKLYRNTCAPVSYEGGFRVPFYENHEDGTVELSFIEYDDVIIRSCGCV